MFSSELLDVVREIDNIPTSLIPKWNRVTPNHNIAIALLRCKWSVASGIVRSITTE
jgi:hypothetical protein